MKTNSNSAAQERFSARFYGAIWRWHFYAGLFVAPFFLIAALTGIVMALNGPIEKAVYHDRLFVEPTDAHLTAETQRAAVAAAYPDATIATYIPPAAPDRTAQFILVNGHAHSAGHGDAGGRIVFVDPYRGDIAGSLDPEKTPYAITKKLHGTLFMGAVGDHLVEIVAGFGILMIATGLYLWFPRGGAGFLDVIFPKVEKLNRQGWRSLHAAAGFWAAPVFLFFLISGLAWTPVWGEKLTQAWSSFPATRFSAPVSEETHASLDHGDHRQTPWALTQTPLPQSPHHHHGAAFDLDAVVNKAKAEGFTGFRVNFPKGATGAWTISATTMSGDIIDPQKDRTMHLDPLTGEIIAEIGFAEYSLAGKAMAAGVPFHQASLGPWNIAFNILFCLTVIATIGTAFAMWLARRPSGKLRLVPPPLPSDRRRWEHASIVMLALAIFFPLTAGVLVVVVAADLLVFSRRAAAPAA